jgi:spermidine synthase
MLINTPTFGNILFMDDAVQSSEYDYELYHRVLVMPMASHIGVEGRHAVVFGGGEGCTSAELIDAGAKHVTQIDHDGDAIEWARKALIAWNKGIYERKESLNVIIDDAFEVMKSPAPVQVPLVVVDLFDPDKDTLEEYASLLVHISESWLTPDGGIVAYFGLWPNAAISRIEGVMRVAGLSGEFNVHGYVHYIASFCSECLFLVIVRAGSGSGSGSAESLPRLEAGSRWVF